MFGIIVDIMLAVVFLGITLVVIGSGVYRMVRHNPWAVTSIAIIAAVVGLLILIFSIVIKNIMFLAENGRYIDVDWTRTELGFDEVKGTYLEGKPDDGYDRCVR